MRLVHRVSVRKGRQVLRRRTTSILYVNGRCHAGRKDDARRHLIEMDPDGDALGKPHPGEDGVDICDPLTGSLRIRNVDRASNAVDVTTHDLTVAHQLDLGRIADADGRKVCFLEISVDPERVSINQQRLTNNPPLPRLPLGVRPPSESHLTRAQPHFFSAFFIGFTSADSLINSNRSRCRATSALSWTEIAATLASEA